MCDRLRAMFVQGAIHHVENIVERQYDYSIE